MNLRQLEAFVRVAETKSFSAAAKQLYLTQPTVSAHISSLEKELHACLLIRNTKSVELSEAGKELYAYAEQILELERKIDRRFGLERREGGGVLRIAASTVPAQYLLPDIMAAFLKECPEERVKVLESDSSEVAELIRTHKADIGFTGTLIEKGNCTYLPFYQDELVLITPAAQPFAAYMEGKREMGPWITDIPFIMREEGSGTRREAERILLEAGICPSDFRVAAVVENPETVKRCVKNGMGISILSRLTVEEELGRGKLLAFSLGKTGGKRDIHLVYDGGYPSLPSADRLIQIVKQIHI